MFVPGLFSSGALQLFVVAVQDMDRDVLRVGRELALCTLDVQLDALYLTLEEEVRQFLDVEAGAEISGQEPAAELAQVYFTILYFKLPLETQHTMHQVITFSTFQKW